MSKRAPIIALAVLGVVALIAFFSLNERPRVEHVGVFEHITVGDKRIAIRAEGKPDAVILEDGSLLIGETPQATGDAQKAQLKSYYENAVALRQAAIGTAKEGVATATTAVASVVKGLSNGTPDRIGDDIDKQAAKVDAHAQEVEKHLATMRTLQNEIVEAVPAFAPYAFIDK